MNVLAAFARLVPAFALTVALSGCGGQRGAHSATVLVYMMADNDLEADALYNLAQAVNAGSGGKYTMLAQVDRSKRHSADAAVNLPNWTGAKRLRVDGGKLTELGDLGEVNMAATATLADFLAWGAQTAPADRNFLILWDHGAGWSGYGADESAPRSDNKLTLAKLKQALDAGAAQGGPRHFELIGFDACLMSTLETALVLAPYADVLVASEELEPGHGWDYGSFRALAGNTDLASGDVGKALVAGFEAIAVKEKTHDEITLAVTDLRAIAQVGQAVQTLAMGLMPADASAADAAAAQIGQARGQTQQYGQAKGGLGSSSGMVDLGDLAAKISAARPELAAPAKAVTDALAAAIVARTSGKAVSASTGLSIYFPDKAGYTRQKDAYRGVAEYAFWASFLDQYYGLKAATPPAFQNATKTADLVSQTSDALTISGQLTAGTGKDVTDKELVAAVVSADGNTLTFVSDAPAAIDAGEKVSGSFELTTLTLTQGASSEQVYASLGAKSGGTFEVSVPLLYRPDASATCTADDTCAGGLTCVLGVCGNVVIALLVFDPASMAVTSQTLYAQDGNDSWAELNADAGAQLVSLQATAPAATPTATPTLAAGKVQFDAAQPFTAAFNKLAPGGKVTLLLTVGDFSGDEDTVSFSATL